MAERQRDKLSTKTGSRIPHFKNVEEAAQWFDTHDTAEYEDEFEDVEEPAEFVVRRAPASKAITVRVDERTMASLTKEATEQGLGPSTLVRMWILEHLRERHLRSPSG